MKLYCGDVQYGEAVGALVTPAAGPRYAGFGGASCVIPKGSYKLITLKADVPVYGDGPYGTGGASYYTNPRDFLEFYIQVPSLITGISTDTIIARGAGLYAKTTGLASSSASKIYPFRASLSASIACNGLCTGRTRASSDKVANLSLIATGDADAQFRQALNFEDDSTTTYVSCSASSTGLDIYTSNCQATTTAVDNSSAIGFSASSTVTGATVLTHSIAFTASSSLAGYSRVEMWVLPFTSTAAAEQYVYWGYN